MKKILLSLSLIPLAVQAQDFNTEFQRQLYIQNLENISRHIVDKFQLNFNIILLDTTQAADSAFLRGTYQNPTHPNYFLVSAYSPQTVLGSNTAPGCMIIINYNNRMQFDRHAAVYAKELGVGPAKEFVNYMLMSHELGHCLARNKLGIDAVNENYADSIATFLINNSPYKNLTAQWVGNLKRNIGMHQTYNYVSQFYEQSQNMTQMPDVLNLLARNRLR